ncbi:hypothetical protein B4U80_14734, partial [Leptotrombidium deliense]
MENLIINNTNRRKQLTCDQKCTIAVLSSHGFNNSEIGRQFNRSAECIRKVINRWLTERTNKRKVGTGLKRKTTETEDQQIRDYAKHNRKDTRQQILNAFDLNICKTILTKRLKEVD